MSDDWPVQIGDREFKQVPETWIDAGVDTDRDRDGPRLYAVSVQVLQCARSLRVRYGHPRTTKVLEYLCGAVENSNGKPIPANLATRGKEWPRSLVPQSGSEPVGHLRKPESEYLRELWADRADAVLSTDDLRAKLCDGGAVRGAFDA